ncbi:MAG: hypothetical protein JJU12_07850 [Chlamydiales bacterium]|nr:hypothetical protein [Chlamydiales bacterium]
MKALCIFLSALSLSLPSYGVIFIVPSGETETTPIELLNEGDLALIEKGGTLSTGGDTAVTMQEDNQRTRNRGTIETTGDNAFGIRNVVGDDVVITNSGTITTQGDFSAGIANQGGNNVLITNSGTISTQGLEASGIFTNGPNTHIVNSGRIRAADGFAIQSEGFNPTLTLLRGSNLQGPVGIFSDFLTLNVETGLNLLLTLTPDSDGFSPFQIDAPFVQVGNTIVVIDPTGFVLQANVIADLSDTVLSNIYSQID